jgi:N-acetyl sugar amidotransferase
MRSAKSSTTQVPGNAARYGLPEQVAYCSRCVLSNQRPSSVPEFHHTPERAGANYLHLDDDGVCDACRYAEQKDQIDWDAREAELLQLLDQHRRSDGGFDCLVPGSGGKDSVLAAHILKTKYGMHPLTVTWPPILYTDYGYRNFLNWIDEGGFDNISYRPNGRVHRLLTRLSIENLLHPFQTFILGQKNLAPKMALAMGIPLIFYGEAEAEYGNPIVESQTGLRNRAYYTSTHSDELFLAGLPLAELKERHGLSANDLGVYFPPAPEQVDRGNIELRFLGYYVKWTPQEAYYYAVEHTNFEARPFRSQGTYSKYNSIDDKIDDLHYYTTWIKFGLGRASYDASQEIRNKHVTREEGVALVKRFDGEFPDKYFNEVMDSLEMRPERFHELCDQFRSPHLWERADGEWRLRHPIWTADTRTAAA